MNKRGYMLAEIIVTVALASVILFFIINLVINLKNKQDNIYFQTMNSTNEALFLSKISNDLKDYDFHDISYHETSTETIVIINNDQNITKAIRLNKETKTIEYGIFDQNNNTYDNTNYYQKILPNNLSIDQIIITNHCYQPYYLVNNTCQKESNSVIPSSVNAMLELQVVTSNVVSDYQETYRVGLPYKIS